MPSATKLLRTTLALQHLAHVRLAVRASNQIDMPPVNLTYCQNRDIDLSTTRPISAARNDRPAASKDSTDLSLPASNIQLYLHDSTYASYPRRTSSCAHLRLDHTSCRHHPSSRRLHTSAQDFTYTFVIPAINRHFCCICYLASLSPSLSLVVTTHTH